ncbi:MAG TPA: hypothetical protein VHZ24_05405, partial [Pirellulales bacterium]|nr:hypothetical protein [Pirellulales bacterium]
NADPQRVAYATSVGKQIEQQFPTMFAEPEVQFPWLATLAHNEQHPDEVKRQFGALAGTRPHDAWWSCAAAETSLREQGKNDNNSMPQPVWRVAACGARPKLDGRLDEEFWQAASPIALRSTLGDDHDWPAEALAASDGKFLYLAFRCRQPDVSNDAPLASKRTRDPDLSGNERIELFLDVDRDRATWYRLVIDHRGWVAEDCWGDKSWNPTWYVAVDRTAGAWTIEAALPMNALVPTAPQAGAIWAIGAQRIVPGLGFQSWSAPAAVTPMPEGFGLMEFE